MGRLTCTSGGGASFFALLGALLQPASNPDTSTSNRLQRTVLRPIRHLRSSGARAGVGKDIASGQTKRKDAIQPLGRTDWSVPLLLIPSASLSRSNKLAPPARSVT